MPMRFFSKNIILLFIAQAIAMTASIAIINFGPLVGGQLGPSGALATLPVTFAVSGAALSTGALSLFMARFGRRTGFRLASMVGFVGALVCAYAIQAHQFWLFCWGALLFGVFQGSMQYFRFAASESVPPHFAAKAISYVLLGSVIAALLVPFITRFFVNFIDNVPMMGIFLYSAAALLILQIPYALMGKTHVYAPPGPPSQDEPDVFAQETKSAHPARPMAEIFRQKAIWAAMINCGFGYGMMAFVMTATPLAMQVCGFSSVTSTQVISLHAIGMFLPGLFTGSYINRFGVFAVLTAGHMLFALAFIVALLGVELWHFTLALVLLGVGWNFCFVGGTTLLTRLYWESEAGKVQGLNETMVVSFMALASLGAGFILNLFGWQTVNQIAFTMLLVAVVLTGFSRRQIAMTEEK